MKTERDEHPPLLRLAAILYFMGSSMLVQFTTKVCTPCAPPASPSSLQDSHPNATHASPLTGNFHNIWLPFSFNRGNAPNGVHFSCHIFAGEANNLLESLQKPFTACHRQCPECCIRPRRHRWSQRSHVHCTSSLYTSIHNSFRTILAKKESRLANTLCNGNYDWRRSRGSSNRSYV